MGVATVRRHTRRIIEQIPSIRNLSNKCPPGQVLRKGYTRHYSTAVRARGFTVKRTKGREYRVHPTSKDMYVEARCVKDNGPHSKSRKSAKQIGPLRKGELAKYGYSFRVPKSTRHAALKKAVNEYSSLGVFRKLDAVAKLTENTLPSASKIFREDRKWVESTFGIKESP